MKLGGRVFCGCQIREQIIVQILVCCRVKVALEDHIVWSSILTRCAVCSTCVGTAEGIEFVVVSLL
jgi:hypothetical protein